MKVLGLDTSAVSASVAIVEEGELLSEHAPISLTRTDFPSRHSEALLPLIDRVLQDLELDFSDLAALGVSIGPGSFTGLRIGLSTVKGLAYGSEVPVFGVRTLEAMARCIPRQAEEHFICPFIDARKGQVYAALYRSDGGELSAVMSDTIDTPESVLERVHELTTADCLFVGEGTRVYAGLIEKWMRGRASLITGEGYPSTASGVALITEERLIEGVPDSLYTLMPDYLRPPGAVPPKPRPN